MSGKYIWAPVVVIFKVIVQRCEDVGLWFSRGDPVALLLGDGKDVCRIHLSVIWRVNIGGWLKDRRLLRKYLLGSGAHRRVVDGTDYRLTVVCPCISGGVEVDDVRRMHRRLRQMQPVL